MKTICQFGTQKETYVQCTIIPEAICTYTKDITYCDTRYHKINRMCPQCNATLIYRDKWYQKCKAGHITNTPINADLPKTEMEQ